MNQYPGVIGRKLGMTQIFAEDGTVVPCTVVESQVTVIGKRTKEKDGYDALILGTGELKEKHTSKAVAGQFKKANVQGRKTLRELRCSAEFAAGYELGAELKVDEIFEEGQKVDVQATSRGFGFQGVVKRHHFRGGRSSHGSMFHRAPGSIGGSSFPSRVYPGMRGTGRMGGDRVTVKNLLVVKIDEDKNLLYVRGAVPGGPNGYVTIQRAKRG